MAHARERAEWGRASCIMSVIANANRDTKKHGVIGPEKFNPHAKKPAVVKGSIRDLKTVFIDKKLPKSLDPGAQETSGGTGAGHGRTVRRRAR